MKILLCGSCGSSFMFLLDKILILLEYLEPQVANTAHSSSFLSDFFALLISNIYRGSTVSALKSEEIKSSWVETCSVLLCCIQ